LNLLCVSFNKVIVARNIVSAKAIVSTGSVRLEQISQHNRPRLLLRAVYHVVAKSAQVRFGTPWLANIPVEQESIGFKPLLEDP